MNEVARAAAASAGRRSCRWSGGVLDFKGGIALIEAGYRYTAETLATSGLAKRFVT
jgi:hypothetical protein